MSTFVSTDHLTSIYIICLFDQNKIEAKISTETELRMKEKITYVAITLPPNPITAKIAREKNGKNLFCDPDYLSKNDI